LIHGWLINGVVFEMQAFLIIVLILSVVLPLFTKRAFYCTYVCPFGALQELAGKTCKRKVKIPRSVTKVLRFIRPLILLVVLLLLAFGLSLPLGDMEPFSIFHLKAASLVVIVLASLMVIVSVFIPKFWCKYLCPTGMILELFRKPIMS
jgi:polyferredoxin